LTTILIYSVKETTFPTKKKLIIKIINAKIRIENQIRKTEAHKINTNILFTILLNTAPTNLKGKLKKKGYSSITNKNVPTIAKTSFSLL
jgi:hypothetical protein